MYKSLIGALAGGACGLAFGFVVGLWINIGEPNDRKFFWGLFLGCVLAGNTAIAGAVVGAVGEITAILQAWQADATPDEPSQSDS
jgi:hypothetical protein